LSDTALIRSIADALQEGHAISQHVSAKALHDAADEIEYLRSRLAAAVSIYELVEAAKAKCQTCGGTGNAGNELVGDEDCPDCELTNQAQSISRVKHWGS
jgi:hypothetical protein